MSFSRTPALRSCAITIFFVSLCASMTFVSGQGACTLINSCSCKYEDGTTVDLSPLASNGDIAAFADVDDQQSTDQFSWNPCNAFTEGTCSGVAVCQIRPAVPDVLYFSLGTQDSASFLKDDQGGLIIQYSDDTVDNTLRTTNIALICDESTEKSLVAKGEEGALAIYDLELTSKYACPGQAPPASSTSGPALSVGSILVISFFAILVLYFVAGAVFQVGVRKATGRERLPNYGFWSGIPSLVMTGCKFTIRRGKITKYDSI